MKGPVRDWPLALCDASTVDPKDVQPGDLVYGNYVVENCQVHESPSQKWYYLRDQGPEEAWVFVQSDSVSSRPGKIISSCSELHTSLKKMVSNAHMPIYRCTALVVPEPFGF